MLVARGIQKRYGSLQVLRGVDITLEKGERSALSELASDLL